MKEYLIWDNGGAPFKVLVKSNSVSIYVIDGSACGTHCGTYRHWKDFKFDEIFIGFHGTEFKVRNVDLLNVNPEIHLAHLILLPQEDWRCIGNSILIRVKDNQYIYIGSEIYGFHTDERIIRYYSKIGNSSVPYPVAEGEENIYFMLDKKYVKRDKFPKATDWEDAYMWYYGHYGLKKLSDFSLPMINAKSLHQRLW